MNIFRLDLSTKLAAQALSDKHISSAINESLQLMSNAHHYKETKLSGAVFAETHMNHPCSVWVRESINNYLWMVDYCKWLFREWGFRYGTAHQSELVYELLQKPPGLPYVSENGTKPPLAMPEKFHHPNFIASYRRYYRSKAVTMKMLWLRGRMAPDWWNEPQYWYPSLDQYLEVSKNGSVSPPENRS